MSPTQAGATVRYAAREDVPTILQLIQELADYEKESSSNQATIETLSNTITFTHSGLVSPQNTTPSQGDSISSARPARCLLLFTPNNEPAGMALYFYNYSTWRAKPGIYLEDLYVREKERGKGYGWRLLGELAKEVVGMDGGRLEWSVLTWNEPAIKFYQKIGAKAMSEWQTMRVDGDALVELAKNAAP